MRRSDATPWNLVLLSEANVVPGTRIFVILMT
jgi:hypothetical protein